MTIVEGPGGWGMGHPPGTVSLHVCHLCYKCPIRVALPVP